MQFLDSNYYRVDPVESKDIFVAYFALDYVLVLLPLQKKINTIIPQRQETQNLPSPFKIYQKSLLINPKLLPVTQNYIIYREELQTASTM